MDSIPLPILGGEAGRAVPLPAHEEDPYELVGMVLPGEPGQSEAMAQAIVEEFILLGWSEKQLMTLFTSPLYLGTHRIYQEKGAAWVEALITDLVEQWRPRR